MKTKIGTITLNRTHKFTQYHESASMTDYVTCEPQTVDLFTDGYWVFTSFDGVLTSSTYRDIGGPARALVQTQAHGGIGSWLVEDMYTVTLSPEYAVRECGRYPEGCGAASGMAILALAAAA
jgi:hypothetical protein